MSKRHLTLRSIKTWTLLLPLVSMTGCALPPADPAQLRADETALVQATVAEPARAQRLLELIEQRDRLVDETRALLARYRREMKAVNADYDSSREVVVEMIDYYNRDRAKKQLAFIDLISKMKRTTTADEWAVIADFQLRRFNPRELLYRPLEES